MRRGVRRTSGSRIRTAVLIAVMAVLILGASSTLSDPRPGTTEGILGRGPSPSLEHVLGPIAQASSLTVSLSITPNPAVAGQVIYFNATVSNGQAPYSYLWKALPAPCQSPGMNVGNFSCIAQGASSTTVQVVVTDSSSVPLRGSSSVALRVTSAISVAVSAYPANVDAGTTLALNASVTGGSPPYSYVWKGEPSHCAPVPADVANFTCPLSATDNGALTVSVTVTDSSSPTRLIGVGKLNTRVNAIFAVAVSVTPISGTVPFVVHLAATAKGGLPPYLFTWGLPDGSTGAGSPWTYTFTTPGKFNITLWANDSANTHQVFVKQVVALPAPPSTGFLGFTGHTGYYVLAALLAGGILVVVAGVWWWRTHRRPPSAAGGPARPWVPGPPSGQYPSSGVPPSQSPPPGASR